MVPSRETTPSSSSKSILSSEMLVDSELESDKIDSELNEVLDS